MCKIDFKIQYTDADGDSLQGAEGRYKLKSAATFEPVFSINLSNSQTPDITVDGVYDLEVRVQDTKGLWSEWFTSPEGFKIGNCTPNKIPTVNAGINQNISSNNTSVTAIASDSDGTIVSYLWEAIGSGSASITNPNTATTTVTGLTEGSHTFRCTVTDNEGATAFDDVVVVYETDEVENTFFNVVKINDATFKIETSRYINAATFTLKFVEEVREDRDSIDGIDTVYHNYNEVINLTGILDLEKASDKEAIISNIISKPSVIGNLSSWTLVGDRYVIDFNNIQGTADIGRTVVYLDKITNISAT